MRLILLLILATIILHISAAKNKEQRRFFKLKKGGTKGGLRSLVQRIQKSFKKFGEIVRRIGQRKEQGTKVQVPMHVGKEENPPTEDTGYRGGRHRRREKFRLRNRDQNTRIKSEMCAEKKRGKRRFRFMTCKEADKIEDDVFFIKSKIAQLSGPGSVEHELAHALGMFHEQSRSDRDNYITIDSNFLDNFQFKLCNSSIFGDGGCMDPDYEYDFGSVMQYYAGAFGSGNITMKAVDPRYQYTMGWDKSHLSFLDLKKINNVYCKVESSHHEQVYDNPCTSGPNCENGGYRNPAKCSTCLCPDVWGGLTCSERFTGLKSLCGEELVATGDWQTVKQSGAFSQGDKCIWKIDSPPGTKIEYKIVGVTLITTTCWLCNVQFLEIRDDAEFINTGPRYCTYANIPDPQQWTSETNRIFLIAHDIDDEYAFGNFTVDFRCVGAGCSEKATGVVSKASTETPTTKVTTTTSASLTSVGKNVTVQYCCWYDSDTYCRVYDYTEYTDFPAKITTPNYPKIYPYYYKCTWILTASPGHKVNIKFYPLNIEDGWDPVSVYDGIYSSLTIKCEHNEACNGRSYQSSSEKMTIEFYQKDSYTSNEQSETGFNIDVQPT